MRIDASWPHTIMTLPSLISNGLQVLLAVILFVWCVLSLIMLFEDENRGKVAQSSYDWITKFAPRWYKVLTICVALPVAIVLVLIRFLRL